MIYIINISAILRKATIICYDPHRVTTEYEMRSKLWIFLPCSIRPATVASAHRAHAAACSVVGAICTHADASIPSPQVIMLACAPSRNNLSVRYTLVIMFL